jgi:D-xylonolactonase
MSKEVQQTVNTFFSGELNCGESPLYDHRHNLLYWIDHAQAGLFRYDFSSAKLDKLSTPADVTFVTLQQNDGLLLGSTEGIFTLSESGKVRKNSFSGDLIPYKLNDAIADPKGRIFTGQEAYSDDAPDNVGYLFRISTDGQADIVEEGLSIANGMGFSPDQTVFYLIDTIRRELYAYDYSPESGDIRNRKVLRKFLQEEGLPDGMAVDEEGFLWVAMWFGSAIFRLDPSGNVASKIQLPFAQPTSLGFGGTLFQHLYITSAAHYWETPLAPRNHDYTFARGGGVYCMETDFKGVPEYIAALK